MPDDEDHAVADQLVCCGDRLCRVAEVVAHDQLALLAEEAALGVEICGRHRSAALELLAKLRLRAGHWASHTNQDLGPRDRCPDCRDADNTDEEKSPADHGPALRPVALLRCLAPQNRVLFEIIGHNKVVAAADLRKRHP
jgi:hypothetical protein